MLRENSKTIPPDGGWGWIIMGAFTLCHFVFIPIQQNFGLLYKEAFQAINLSGSDVTSIISTHIASESFTGLITVPLIKLFKIRKVAFAGTVLFCAGLLSTINANTYIQFLLCYGIISGLGAGLMRLTHVLSLNLYFRKRRHKVVGISLGIRSLGSVVMPQLIVFLLSKYGVQSTVLYLVSLALHLLCTSLLLHPVEWHSKRIPIEEQRSVEFADLLLKDGHLTSTNVRNTKQSILDKVVRLLDLKVLKNKDFLIICLGITFAIFSNLMFPTLLPLILADLNFTNQEIATFLSVGHISGIVARLMVPFVGDFLKRSSRFMYMVASVCSIAARFALIYSRSFNSCVAISVLWGAAKGVESVYWTVIFADNVPTEMLASAESINMVVNGLILLLGGPLLGLAKDATGSYVFCVYILNAFSFVTCLVWLVDFMYKYGKK